MCDEDPTKKLPDGSTTEQLTVTEHLSTIMERLDAIQRSAIGRHEYLVGQIDAVREHFDLQIREARDLADRRHAETNANFRKLGDKMDILNRRVLESEANQVDLRRRIEELETQAS